MKRKIIIIALCMPVLLTAVAIWFLKSDYFAETIKAYLTKTINKQLGVQLSIGKLELKLLPLKAVLKEVKLRVLKKRKFFSAAKVMVDVKFLPLITGRVVIKQVMVTRPKITMVMKGKQILNFPTIPKRKKKSDSKSPVVLKEVILEDGFVNVFAENPPGLKPGKFRLQLRELTARYHSKRSGFHALDFTSKSGLIDSPDFSDSFYRLKGMVHFAQPMLTLQHLELGLKKSRTALFVTASTENLMEVITGKKGKFTSKVIASLPIGLVKQVFPRSPSLKGRLSIVADVMAELPEKLQAKGHFDLLDGKIGKRRLGNIKSRFTVTPKSVVLSKMKIESPVGQVQSNGTVYFKKNLPLRFSARFSRMQLAKLLALIGTRGNRIVMSHSGSLNLRGHIGRSVKKGKRSKWTGFYLDGEILADVRNFKLHSRSLRRGAPGKPIILLPAARVKARVRLDKSQVAIRQTSIRIGRSILNASGRFNFGNWMALNVRSRWLRLKDVGAVNGMAMKGSGPLKVTIQGPYSNPAIVGNIDLHDAQFRKYLIDRLTVPFQYRNSVLTVPVFSAVKNRSKFSGTAALMFRKSPTTVKAELDIHGARTEDIFSLLRLKKDMNSKFNARISGAVRVSGNLLRPKADVELRLNSIFIAKEPFDRGLVEAHYRNGRIDIDRVVIWPNKGPGNFMLVGNISPKLELDIWAYSKGFSMRTFRAPVLKKMSLAADIDLLARFLGTLKRPKVEGRIILRNTHIRYQNMEDSELLIRGDGSKVVLEGKFFGQAVRLTGQLDLAKTLPFKLTAGFNKLDVWRIFRKEGGGFGSAITGLARLSGSIKKLMDKENGSDWKKKIKGEVFIQEVSLTIDDMLFTNERPFLLDIQKGEFELSPMQIRLGERVADNKIRFDKDTNLGIGGKFYADGRLAMRIEGRGDLTSLGKLVPTFEKVRGKVAFTSQLSGTFDKPTFLGSGGIQGGYLKIKSFPNTISRLKGKLRFTENKVLLTHGTGFFGGGRVNISGAITLDHFLPKFLRFGIDVKQARLQFPADFPSILKGKLVFSSNFKLHRITGDIIVVRARYEKAVQFGELFFKRARRTLPKSFMAGKENFVINVNITSPGNIRIINNLIDIEMKGNLNLKGTNKRLSMKGVLSMVKEGKLRIRKNTFTLRRAFVTFKEEEPIEEPFLDIVGDTTVRDYFIKLTIKGPASNPKIDYSSSDAKISREDIVLLLNFGTTMKELNQLSPDKMRSFSFVALGDLLGMLSGLDEKVRRHLPVFDTFQLSSGYSESSKTTVPFLTLGKRIGKRIVILGSTSLNDPNKDFKAQIRLSLRKNLFLTGQYVNNPRSQQGSVSESLGDIGVDLTWRLDF